MFETKEVIETFNFGCKRIFSLKRIPNPQDEHKELHIMHGEFKEYDAQGKLHFEAMYTEGKLDGSETGWHPNGQCWWKATNNDGRRDGEWNVWYPSGKLRTQATYEQGNIKGKMCSWNEQGELILTQEY